MTLNANLEAERASRAAGQPGAGSGAAFPGNAAIEQPTHHDPEATALLRRYLSEIHSYRQLGNVALRELESRLTALIGEQQQQAEPEPVPEKRAPVSHLMQSTMARPEPGEAHVPTLGDRLRELSAYLHADLTRHEAASQTAAGPEEFEAAPPPPLPYPEEAFQRPRSEAPKSKPMAPVLDRLWFEDRFAEMRASVDQLAEKIPTGRLDALEAQFHALMEKLDTREHNRSMAPVEAGLKKLAAYLEDNRHWTAEQDSRMQGVEDRLDQLSGLVAQSHAAISATARGLEIVAKGTGPNLAHATAELVAEKMGEQIDEKIAKVDASKPLDDLSREVATLSFQSNQHARQTDDRLRNLQISLDESLDRLNEDLREAAQKKQEPQFDAETYEDEEEDYDGELVSAAQRAARLTDGAKRNVPDQGEPVRYQIPYGEFLPDEDRGHPRTGLIVAAVILLLASAAMLYLNLRDRTAEETPKPKLSSLAAPSAPPMPRVIPVIQRTKTVDRIQAAPAVRAHLGNEVWVTSVIAEETTPRISNGLNSTAALGSSSPEGAAPAGESVRKAAVSGDLNAQFSIGESYLDGSDVDQQLPVSERLSKAARWFRRAAENGHASSQYRLATLYELGQGAPKSTAEAMVWYERAALQGHVKAMHNLAVLSVTGNGKSANYLTAAKWFTKAAEHGLRDSQYNLGILFERGLGVERSPAKAYQWFAIAARRGDVNAAEKRDALAAFVAEPDRQAADRYAAIWTVTPSDEAANRAAPEPPVESAQRVDPVIQPKAESAQVMNASWNAQVTRGDNLVFEAQRLLGNLGFKPGPVDGILGPRTLAAIREFEKRIGIRSNGQITESLLAKMAFAVQ